MEGDSPVNRLHFLVCFVLFLAISCGDPKVSDEKFESFIDGNTDFALDLYQSLVAENPDSNLFYSPHSISCCLSMSMLGARGRTEQEMGDVLHRNLDSRRHHIAFTDLNERFEQHAMQPGIELSVSNQIWAQSGHPFHTQYTDSLSERYGTGLENVDFAGNASSVERQINDWARLATNNRINNLLPRGTVTPENRLVLANAIYFRGEWQYKFDPRDTRSGQFVLLNGTYVNVPMMMQKNDFRIAGISDSLGIQLPYAGGDLDMLIIYPDFGQFYNVENNLDRAYVDNVVKHLSERDSTTLYMPKFRIETTYSLESNLADMGMPSAFNGSDFSGMDGSTDLFINFVIHAGYIAVDETGTEAAAVTAVGHGIGLFVPEVIRIERPFIYLIRETETGAILFAGRVVDPRI